MAPSAKALLPSTSHCPPLLAMCSCRVLFLDWLLGQCLSLPEILGFTHLSTVWFLHWRLFSQRQGPFVPSVFDSTWYAEIFCEWPLNGTIPATDNHSSAEVSHPLIGAHVVGSTVVSSLGNHQRSEAITHMSPMTYSGICPLRCLVRVRAEPAEHMNECVSLALRSSTQQLDDSSLSSLPILPILACC